MVARLARGWVIKDKAECLMCATAKGVLYEHCITPSRDGSVDNL